jgi:hypothetical protein
VDLPSLARDLDKLATADAVVADSYIRYALRKGALYLFACLLAIASLTLLGLSLYWLLEQSMGPIGAAALIGIIGLLLAAIIAVAAVFQRPGREFSIGLEIRRTSIATLEQNVSAPSANPGAYIYPASEALVTSVVLPLMGALLRTLKSSRSKAVEKSAEPGEVEEAKAEPIPQADGAKE